MVEQIFEVQHDVPQQSDISQKFFEDAFSNEELFRLQPGRAGRNPNNSLDRAGEEGFSKPGSSTSCIKGPKDSGSGVEREHNAGPEKIGAILAEKNRLNERVDAVATAVCDGTFDNAFERNTVRLAFSAAAKHGRDNEEALLVRINKQLQAGGAEYQVRFGQNIIKTPGGRRLEIMDRDGNVVDALDFIVPLPAEGASPPRHR